MLVLYTSRSSASYRVRIALELKGLAYEAVPVHLVRGGGEQHSAAFATLNPAELVPVLVDGEVTLTQSLPIIEYLEERHPAPALLPPDPPGRARVRAIAQTIACEIHPLNNLRVLQRLEATLGASAQAKSAWYAHWVALGFTVVEAMLSQSAATGRYCHCDTPTLADCCLVPQIYNAERFGVSLAAYPTLRRIGQACLELPAFEQAHRLHEDLVARTRRIRHTRQRNFARRRGGSAPASGLRRPRVDHGAQEEAAALANQSIKRFVDPADIAALAVFLASDAARSISGKMIPIDGDSQSAS